ncbi:MAG: hypothetical protein ACOX3L_02335 [Lutisporaceae bacterium]
MGTVQGCRECEPVIFNKLIGIKNSLLSMEKEKEFTKYLLKTADNPANIRM